MNTFSLQETHCSFKKENVIKRKAENEEKQLTLKTKRAEEWPLQLPQKVFTLSFPSDKSWPLHKNMVTASINDVGDVRSLAQIFRSGDLLLDNPAETCIIFVSVIIVSAGLEYLLQIVSRTENKYARLMVATMTRELTIIGVLALTLMLAASLIPAGEKQDRFSIVFTWAEMNLFFMALFFVIVVIAQFLWVAYEEQRWRSFEEGRMDSEELETLSYRERIYRKTYERYSDELMLAFALTPADCALFELLQVFKRRLLVKMSDLTWPVWLSLLPTIAFNGARAYANPLESGGTNYTFYNGLLYIGVTGYVSMVVFLIFFGILHRRLNDLLEKRVRRSTVGAHHVPLGSPKRFVTFLQGITMSLNWYVSLFVTGMGKDILTDAARWQVAVMVILFVIPIIVVHLIIPWCVMILALMSVMGSVAVHQSKIERVMRRHAGAEDEDEDAMDLDSEEEKEMRKELERRASANREALARHGAAARAGKRPPGAALGGRKSKGPSQPPPRPAPAPSSAVGSPRASPDRALAVESPHDATIKVEVNHRPIWLEDDEPWAGSEEPDTAPLGKGNSTKKGEKGSNSRNRSSSRAMDPLFYEHIDDSDLREALFRRDPTLKKDLTAANSSANAATSRGGRQRALRGVNGDGDPYDDEEMAAAVDDEPFETGARPSWLESDEEWI